MMFDWSGEEPSPDTDAPGDYIDSTKRSSKPEKYLHPQWNFRVRFSIQDCSALFRSCPFLWDGQNRIERNEIENELPELSG